jgi:hypothetical protein
MSIRRRFGRRRGRAQENSGKPRSERSGDLDGSDRRRSHAIHDACEGESGFGGGGDAGAGRVRRAGEIQRVDAEGGSPAGRRWTAGQFKRGSDQVLRQPANGGRRAIHRDERTDRGLLDDPGQVAGGSNRVGEAVPAATARSRGRDRTAAGVRDVGLSRGQHPSLSRQSADAGATGRREGMSGTRIAR